VVAAEPDTFVCELIESGIVTSAAADHRASLHRPPMSVPEYLEALRRNRLPDTAAALHGEPI
jgi:hypothetical protein